MDVGNGEHEVNVIPPDGEAVIQIDHVETVNTVGGLLAYLVALPGLHF